MQLYDFHTHSVYSDGSNTMEEMVLSAIEKGFVKLGFSDHSYDKRSEDWCLLKGKIPDYLAEAAALKEKYKDKIELLCGIEQEFYGEESTADYDYAIGSVHYILVEGRKVPIDEGAKVLQWGARKCCGGDMYALAEEYFRTVEQFAQRDDIDIIGHFDIISKFNEDRSLFDPDHPRYIAAWQAAADKLLAAGKVFEINTGAISRGYRTQPYPSLEMIDYISKKGGSFIFSSDAHSAENLGFEFEKWAQVLKDIKLKCI